MQCAELRGQARGNICTEHGARVSQTPTRPRLPAHAWLQSRAPRPPLSRRPPDVPLLGGCWRGGQRLKTAVGESRRLSGCTRSAASISVPLRTHVPRVARVRAVCAGRDERIAGPLMARVGSATLTAGRGRTHVRVGPVAFGMPVRADEARSRNGAVARARFLGGRRDAWKEGVPESEGLLSPGSCCRTYDACDFCAALTDLPAASFVGWCRLRFACGCAVAAAR